MSEILEGRRLIIPNITSKSGDRIFIVTALFIKDGNTVRDRNWGYYFSLKEAIYTVENNISDLFEMGYYNYAKIVEQLPGVCSSDKNINGHWYKVTYNEYPISIHHEPNVTPCENPVPGILFGIG